MPKTYPKTIDLILESGKSLLNISLFNESESISDLYLDCYFFTSDNELPPTSKNYTIGFLLAEESHSEISLCLLSKIKSDNLILRCLDDKVDSFYYLIYSGFLGEMEYLLIKYPFAMLTPDPTVLQSFIYLRPEEINFQFNYFSWLSAFNRSLLEWMNYSSSQKTQKLILSQELKELKDSSCKQSSKSFGLCLFCYERCRNIVFLPCGHMAACLQCSVRKLKVEITQDEHNNDSSPKCPLCKQSIQKSIEILN